MKYLLLLNRTEDALPEPGTSAGQAMLREYTAAVQAMAAAGPVMPSELARRTGTTERYLREWLNAQAAGGYVEYDAGTGRYELPPEQDQEIAATKLATMGLTIDALTQEQITYAKDYSAGT